MADEVLQYAIMRWVQIIGEAARKVSPEFQAEHPEIPWIQIVGMRNRLVHEYFRINTRDVWKTINEDIPPLIVFLEAHIPPEDTT